MKKNVLWFLRFSILALLLLSLVGCTTPEGWKNVAVQLLEPVAAQAGMELEPEFSWELEITPVGQRTTPFFKLFVAPVGEAFSLSVQTNQLRSTWSEKLLAGSDYHWKVEIWFNGQLAARSEERTFSTQEFYSVEVAVAQALGGKVRVDGGEWGESIVVQANLDTPTRLWAQADENFLLEGWYLGEELLSTDNPFDYVPEQPASTPREEGSDIQLDVRFRKVECAITAVASPSEHGSVRIDGGEWGSSQRVTVDGGDEVSLQALAVSDYHFAGWYEELASGTRGTKVSDANPYEFVAGNDRSLTAAFERDSFTLSVEAEPHAYGSVRVNGGAWAKVHQQEFELGSQVELRALAISGYGFLGWYENGQKISETNTYAFEMNSDRDLEANFFEVPPPWQTLVKAGTFEMGNTREDSEGEEREEPVTEFTLTNDFWIKTWEVTNEEFLEFLNNGGVSWNGYIHGNQILDVEDPDCEFYYEDFSFHYLEGRGNYPAVEMSWLGAAEYCNWLSQKEGYAKAYNSEGDLLDTEGATTADTTKVEGYRIPTEAEWEYSARGGHVDIVNGVEANDYKYAGSNDVDEVGWSHQDGGTHPVWRKEPNELGLYDMSGNVFEWVQDWWCNGYDELASENPIGPYDGSDAKIKRGGSYCSKDKAARVVHRIRMGFDTGPAEQGSAVDTGFRFVRTVIPPPVVEPGTVKWEYTADDEIWSSAAIASDGTIYFTCYDARLYALNSDGSNKWKYSIGGGGLFSSPAIGSDGTIYVGDGNGYLTAINSNGSFGWNFETDARVDSSPAIGSDGTIYVGSDDHNLYSISTDGGQNWEKDLGDYVISSPAIGSDGRIYVGSTSNPFYAVSPEVGGTSWINLNTGGVQSSPAIGSDGTIYVCGKDDHQVHALSTNGTEKTGWPFATGDDIFASPVIGSDGTIYVGSYDAYFYAINPDGTEKWKYQTGDKIDSSAAIGSDGTVYVGSHDQKLYALNSDGTLKWELDLGSEIGASPAIGSDGTIYVGTLSDKFFAVNGNSGGLADTPWPKFRQNEKNTGRDE